MPPDAKQDPPFQLQLCVGQVFHSRLKPRRHKFKHRVFFLRLPLSQLPGASNWMFKLNRWAPLSIHFADYGPGDGSPPQQWLAKLLAQEGLALDGEVVLQTFPRVLGYVFNPVSFWFCHNKEGDVSAIVVEVNNTFGERHCYLLAHPNKRPIRPGETIAARKAFHVSPFFTVEGTYQFRFQFSPENVLARIDHRDHNGALDLQTSIGGGIRPMRTASMAQAMVTHPLMTLGIIARIHYEAIRLWIKGVYFHSKPPAPQSPLTRSEP
jgi:uncharacterized protein